MSKATEINTVPLIFYTVEPFESTHGQSLNQPLHRHSETVELLLVLEGTVHCRLEGKSCKAPAGSVLVIPPGTWHELRYTASKQQSGYRLAFSGYPLLAPSFSDWPPVIPISDLHTLKALFARLQKEKTQPHAEQAVRHLIGLILALISRSMENRKATALHNRENTIQEIKLYMEENHSRSLTLEDIAGRFSLNKYQLARTFQQVTGISPLQYLISCRMDAARQLLFATDMPVAEVAQATGYKSITQFQAAFKKAAGKTPRQYRIACKTADQIEEIK